MKKTPPSPPQIALMSFFILSCLGLALFLWISFGGATPLAPRGYEVKVPFDEATQLAEQADVRVAGVSVGRVAAVELPTGGGRLLATLEIDSRYAPLANDAKATLRQKTLLGETYVEISLGTRDTPTLADGDTLAEGQVTETVQLDQILRRLDPETRGGFQTWMQDSALAVAGVGESLSNAFAHLPPFFDGFEKVFRTLDSQEQAVQHLFSDGAETFDALSRQRGELRSLIESWEAVSRTTARRDQGLVDAFRAFPTFLDESRLTMARLREFSVEADPLMVQLTPAARELSPTLAEIGRLAPEMRGFFSGLDPVIDAAPRSFPALRRLFRDQFPPILRALDPFLRNLNPLIEVIRVYRRELAALLGNASAATNAGAISDGLGRPVRYLRTMNVFTPEAFASFPRRLEYNRANPYMKPGAYGRLAQGLEGFEVRQCGSGINGILDPDTPNDPVFNARVDGDLEEAEDLFDRIRRYGFNDQLTTAGLPAMPCVKQGPFGPFGAPGPATDYAHTLRQR